MRVLVLGGYGLIGTHVVRHLRTVGHEVMALGRDVGTAARRMPDVTWIAADLAALSRPEAWADLLARHRPEAIVNGAGVLQDGARDDVAAIQSTAMRALYAAAGHHGVRQFVQISAPRAAPDADTAFMRTKGEADAALQATTLAWVVLRPGLVIAPEAYGGTALLRALAAMPGFQPVAYADRPVHTVGVADVAAAVVDVLAGRIATPGVYDLVAPQPNTLGEIVAAFRAWLGLPPARLVRVPAPLAHGVARIADALGWLGWRSPLRSTAIRELAAGVVGDPKPWRDAGGRECASLATTLRDLPSTVQERWHARLFLLKPVLIAILAAFWLASGAITLIAPDAAAAILASRGMSDASSMALAIGGAIADIAVGLAVLWRRWMPLAAKGMVALTIGYLAGGAWFAPDLWLDPLGPLVKSIPALLPALVLLAISDDR